MSQTFVSTAGNDKFVGTAGKGDKVSYINAAKGIYVELVGGFAVGHGIDILVNIEGVIGSSFDDILVGTAANEYFESGLGDDIVFAGDGNNIVFGGLGNDYIQTGKGDDRIFSEGGDNTIVAGSGNDYIETGKGDDKILAGDGNDIIVAGAGDDYIEGGAGNDSIFASAGNNIIFAGAGDDYIETSAGKDSINGGDGNDIIVASAGDDYLEAGEGNDVLIGGAGSDFLLGGKGADRFVLNSLVGVDNIADFTPGDKDVLVLSKSVFTVLTTKASGDLVSGGTPIETADFVTITTGGATAADKQTQALVYETTTGILYYNPDGSGIGKVTTIAFFTGTPNLTASNILVVA
ncbi:MAG: calcium-binding protein [Pseudanabaenaceae cyanobacterium]